MSEVNLPISIRKSVLLPDFKQIEELKNDTNNEDEIVSAVSEENPAALTNALDILASQNIPNIVSNK